MAYNETDTTIPQEIKDYIKRNNLKCKNIQLPINSDIYAIECNGRWGAFRVSSEEIIIPFGRFSYIWGYKGNYCLVNMLGASGLTHIDRAVIDSKGKAVVLPYKYDDIYYDMKRSVLKL